MFLSQEENLTNSQVKELLGLFGDNENFYYWKIGTSIYSILKSFYTKTKLNKKFFDEVPTLEVRDQKIGDKTYYSLYLKDAEINITPSSLNNIKRNSDWVDDNTLLQFLKVLVSFNCIQAVGSKIPDNASMGEYFGSFYTLPYDFWTHEDFDSFVRSGLYSLARYSIKNYSYSRIICYGIVVNYIAKNMDEKNTIPWFRRSNRTVVDMSVEELLSRPDGYGKFDWLVDEKGYTAYDAAKAFIEKCVPNEKN